eukprot:19-Pelagococcus_subviridis.AAC.1
MPISAPSARPARASNAARLIAAAVTVDASCAPVAPTPKSKTCFAADHNAHTTPPTAMSAQTLRANRGASPAPKYGGHRSLRRRNRIRLVSFIIPERPLLMARDPGGSHASPSPSPSPYAYPA